jgi:hypothetical protein
MPVVLASMPILCVRILALEILAALLGVCSQKFGSVFAPFCCSTVMNMKCRPTAQAYMKWTIEQLQSFSECPKSQT